MEIETIIIKKIVKREQDEMCKNCIFSSEIKQTSQALACQQLHIGMNPQNIIGKVYTGWYGIGIMFNGYIVDPEAICPEYKKVK